MRAGQNALQFVWFENKILNLSNKLWNNKDIVFVFLSQHNTMLDFKSVIMAVKSRLSFNSRGLIKILQKAFRNNNHFHTQSPTFFFFWVWKLIGQLISSSFMVRWPCSLISWWQKKYKSSNYKKEFCSYENSNSCDSSLNTNHKNTDYTPCTSDTVKGTKKTFSIHLLTGDPD